ncbi:UDP-N-acetylmuramoyl-L-alanyl-D-glutamate--2,6-diaminopimelate ligase [Oceanirhabdus sp. W0125-5]|uniref:UDP-N-acetylmuramoyl-L-alanyl-D-glutamate--2, 6-diaminopimelate ligase n=1 Tax=Oceanirhabdus sp. W0125-5 TaxID=2999116 RepID=UPI0022F2C3F3|nr:UDP-N-acetylmuramoyl-L-alanyl-D-glutamate--2,6-diaminopimelate ligase [Oceanirhabdus sp. W0125-5]WBW97481.1 UDP-N-acetylmuramoyl-L-alanyl-D-glutamate--2,6-diaminopimelate ligase [Oceanirhabdus sp. W0125-5]
MNLLELLKRTKYELIQGNLDIDINQIKYDTRRIEEGDIFICLKGTNIDSHNFAKDAVEKGAKALLVEKSVKGIPKDIPVIKVENSRKEMARLATVLYKDPSKDFNLVGLTGTNGKTSVSIFIRDILMNLNKNVGVVGTIGCKINDKDIKANTTTPTTPESPDLQNIFSKMREEKVFASIIEATSVALEMRRVDFCDFDIGVFLNLTQDHLDYHGTMENYKNAKLKLFKKCKNALVNIEDPVSKEIIDTFDGEVVTFGVNDEADLRATNIKLAIDSVEFDIHYKNKSQTVKVNVPGKFTVSNLLAAFGVCMLLGVDFDDVLSVFPKIRGVRGRLEAQRMNNGAVAIVDYAHSPDALESLLESIKEYAEGSIITVFGCGGDRDNTKRPIMGRIAGELSDYVIITSDNPRSEEPESIIDDIEKGIKGLNCNYERISNREEAINKGLKIAHDKDVVVIAGKGHETYQILKNETIHFDDMEIVREFNNHNN